MADTDKNRSKDILGKLLPNNRISMIKFSLIALNILFFCVFAMQLYSFVNKNSESAANIEKEGRRIVVTAKTSELSLNELLPEQLPLEMRAAADTEGLEEQGPMPIEEAKEEIKDDIKTEEQTAEEQAPAPVVLDYDSANLSIILTEVGLKQEMLGYAKKLPKEVSFAFSPYSDEIQSKIDDAKKEGREILLNVMFEPSKYPLTDTGPLTIQSHFEETQNIYRLQNTITGKQDFIGFLTNTDEIITHNLEVVSPVLLNMKEQNKFFLFYKQPVNSYLEKEAKPMAIDIGTVNYLIDESLRKEDIIKALNNVKQELLERKGKIVIAIRPYKNSIDTLNEWLNGNLGPNLQIAPISYFITDN